MKNFNIIIFFALISFIILISLIRWQGMRGGIDLIYIKTTFFVFFGLSIYALYLKFEVKIQEKIKDLFIH